jgi:hypothetical protein
MGYVPDKSCTENQNTYFMFSKLFPKIVPIAIMWKKKYDRDIDVTDGGKYGS